MTKPPFISAVDRGSVRWLTIDQQARRNAVPPAGWRQLEQAFRDFDSSPARVLVVRGAGENFCAGADLDAASIAVDPPSAADNLTMMRGPGDAAVALHRLSKPTIAAVDGVAYGAGMNLALGCDVVIVTDRVRFSEVFVQRGLTLDFGGTWLLPRLVGLARARELALTGREVGAREALEMGLAVSVVEPERLESAATEMAESLARGAPLAQRFIKVGLDRASSMTFEQAIQFESQAQAVLLGSNDLREGVAAFLERRVPKFRGE